MYEEICGECKWHIYEKEYRDWVCVNEESPNYNEGTYYEAGCSCFEQRGIE